MTKSEDGSDELTSLLKTWEVALSESCGFKENVWEGIEPDLTARLKIVRPATFLARVDPRAWSAVAAAVAVLIAIPFADLSASKQNQARLEIGQKRYIESIAPVSSSAESFSIR